MKKLNQVVLAEELTQGIFNFLAERDEALSRQKARYTDQMLLNFAQRKPMNSAQKLEAASVSSLPLKGMDVRRA